MFVAPKRLNPGFALTKYVLNGTAAFDLVCMDTVTLTDEDVVHQTNDYNLPAMLPRKKLAIVALSDRMPFSISLLDENDNIVFNFDVNMKMNRFEFVYLRPKNFLFIINQYKFYLRNLLNPGVALIKLRKKGEVTFQYMCMTLVD
ncbi:unnamed protein product [Bursaphelenchus okinawaensis]|uniref:Uncharacterized protein n=1 Tax=Bursaphelenchus okinawaensis TaxID=465554 RepID=A0A811JSF2_9BILA|nr:unnamed protein product [Bursaphelenchus okinawaensis]CAG9080456.1 unnamed protein product [Bursaphelenchus okinawaensis]